MYISELGRRPSSSSCAEQLSSLERAFPSRFHPPDALITYTRYASLISATRRNLDDVTKTFSKSHMKHHKKKEKAFDSGTVGFELIRVCEDLEQLVTMSRAFFFSAP